MLRSLVRHGVSRATGCQSLEMISFVLIARWLDTGWHSGKTELSRSHEDSRSSDRRDVHDARCRII